MNPNPPRPGRSHSFAQFHQPPTFFLPDERTVERSHSFNDFTTSSRKQTRKATWIRRKSSKISTTIASSRDRVLNLKRSLVNERVRQQERARWKQYKVVRVKPNIFIFVPHVTELVQKLAQDPSDDATDPARQSSFSSSRQSSFASTRRSSLDSLSSSRSRANSTSSSAKSTILATFIKAQRGLESQFKGNYQVFDLGFNSLFQAKTGQSASRNPNVFSQCGFQDVVSFRKSNTDVPSPEQVLQELAAISTWLNASTSAKRVALVVASSLQHLLTVLACSYVCATPSWAQWSSSSTGKQTTALGSTRHALSGVIPGSDYPTGRAAAGRATNAHYFGMIRLENYIKTINPRQFAFRMGKAAKSSTQASLGCSELVKQGILRVVCTFGELWPVYNQFDHRITMSNDILVRDHYAAEEEPSPAHQPVEWRSMILRKILLSHAPKVEERGVQPYFMIFNGDCSSILYSSMVQGVKHFPYRSDREAESTNPAVLLSVDCRLRGDFVLRVYHLSPGKPGKMLFQVRLHTGIVEPCMDVDTLRKFPGEQLVVARFPLSELEIQSLDDGLDVERVFNHTFEMQLLFSNGVTSNPDDEDEEEDNRLNRDDSGYALPDPVDSQVVLKRAGPYPVRSRDSTGPRSSIVVPPLRVTEPQPGEFHNATGDFTLPPIQLKCSRADCMKIDYASRFVGSTPSSPKQVQHVSSDPWVCPSCKQSFTPSSIPGIGSFYLEEDRDHASAQDGETERGDDSRASTFDVRRNNAGQREEDQRRSGHRDEEEEDLMSLHLDKLVSMCPAIPRDILEIHLRLLASDHHRGFNFERELENLILEVLLPENHRYEMLAVEQPNLRANNPSTNMESSSSSSSSSSDDSSSSSGTSSSESNVVDVVTTLGMGLLMDGEDIDVEGGTLPAPGAMVHVQFPWGVGYLNARMVLSVNARNDASLHGDDGEEAYLLDEELARQLQDQFDQEANEDQIPVSLRDFMTSTIDVGGPARSTWDDQSQWWLGGGTSRSSYSGASVSEICALPIHKFKTAAVQHEGTASQCMVCQHHYEEGERIRTLPCFHAYHADCVDEWLFQNKCCPVCKQRIDSM